MTPRSLLFVPGDRPERFGKAAASGADAVILDLEDSVSVERRDAARVAVAAALAAPRTVPLLVRINPLGGSGGGGDAEADLDALAGAPAADGILLPKAEGVRTLDALAERAGRLGLALPPVLPIATETPAALFRLGEYAERAAMLCGLTWGAEDLPAAVGAQTAREADGRYTPPYELARSLCLFGAAAAGVAAIETVAPGFRDPDAVEALARRAARDGFGGMLAIHPAQIAPIHAGLAPDADTVTWAERVLAAFAAADGRGAVALDGRMLDAPHRVQAERVLARAGRAWGARPGTPPLDPAKG